MVANWCPRVECCAAEATLARHRRIEINSRCMPVGSGCRSVVHRCGRRHDGEFLAEFFWRHNVSRALASMEGHDGGVLFYPIALLVGTFPWSLWLIPIVWWGIKAKRTWRGHTTSMTLAGVWVAVTILLFTVASTKLPSYITSCYPGVALVVGGFLKDFAAEVRMPSRGWRTLAGAVAITVAFCLAVDWCGSATQKRCLWLAGSAVVRCYWPWLVAWVGSLTGKIVRSGYRHLAVGRVWIARCPVWSRHAGRGCVS